MKSDIVYCFLCDRKKAPLCQTTVYQSTMHELVETLVSHSTRILSEQNLAQQNCSISQDAHRNLHIFHKNKHYWIFSQDRQIVKIFLAVFRWYFKWMLWLCYTGWFYLSPRFLSQTDNESEVQITTIFP